MSFLFGQPQNWPFIVGQSKIYRWTATNVPDQYGVRFMTGGNNLYFNPIAWVLMETRYQAPNFAVYPWIAIQQDVVDVIQPLSGSDRPFNVTLHLEPGVTGTFVRIF